MRSFHRKLPRERIDARPGRFFWLPAVETQKITIYLETRRRNRMTAPRMLVWKNDGYTRSAWGVLQSVSASARAEDRNPSALLAIMSGRRLAGL